MSSSFLAPPSNRSADAIGRTFKARSNRWTLYRSATAVRMIFGLRVRAAPVGTAYFDPCAVLMKLELIRLLKRPHLRRVIEVGTGRFALLSGALARRYDGRYIACDYDSRAVEAAKAHLAANRLRVEVRKSDALGALAACENDVVFCNLTPVAEPEPLATRLLDQSSEFLASTGRLVLGVDLRRLELPRLAEMAEGEAGLRIERVRRLWTAPHAVVHLRTA
jgi:protein-L-isoaspartate O-methyltransferase